MSITYEDIKKANDSCKTTDIKGNPYVEVAQRIKAFRMVYPQGFIKTEMMSNENGVCLFRAEVGFIGEGNQIYLDGETVGDRAGVHILGTGTAYEAENSSFINETSYIENCETSAVGRALGMAGFGINESVAPYEEVANAKKNQGERKASPKQLVLLEEVYTGDNLKKLLEKYNIEKLADLSLEKASELIGKIKEKEKANGKAKEQDA